MFMNRPAVSVHQMNSIEDARTAIANAQSISPCELRYYFSLSVPEFYFARDYITQQLTRYSQGAISSGLCVVVVQIEITCATCHTIID